MENRRRMGSDMSVTLKLLRRWLREFLSSPDFPTISGDLVDFGRIRGISGKFMEIQWGFVNLVEFLGDFGPTPGFAGKSGVWVVLKWAANIHHLM